VFQQDEKEFYSAFYPHLFHFQPDAARQRRFEGPSRYRKTLRIHDSEDQIQALALR
jgi:hypothetical protein